jgi:hypothetical protein
MKAAWRPSPTIDLAFCSTAAGDGCLRCAHHPQLADYTIFILHWAKTRATS